MNVKKWVIFLSLFLPTLLFGGIYPQAGVEFFMGTNAYWSLAPWMGIRVGVSNNSSVIFKTYCHNLGFDYLSDEGTKESVKAKISNFTLAYYYQKNKIDFYIATSFLRGTRTYFGDRFYRGTVLDAGIEYRISKVVAFEAGIYLIEDTSVLWFPDEEPRNIFTSSIKGGVKIKLAKPVTLNANAYFLRNSYDVSAFSYSIGLIIIPFEPACLTVYYWKYNENTEFRFRGDYLSLGLNFYF
jgi:hypothetical protein